MKYFQTDILGEIRQIISIRQSGSQKVLVASDQVETESFEWPGLSEDSSEPLFRFGSDIGCLAAIMSDVRDDQIAAGAGDFKIKWKNMLDQREMTLTGHEAPILSIALDPLGEILVSSSCDGTFRNDFISFEKK